jgi:hypothetical protein
MAMVNDTPKYEPVKYVEVLPNMQPYVEVLPNMQPNEILGHKRELEGRRVVVHWINSSGFEGQHVAKIIAIKPKFPKAKSKLTSRCPELTFQEDGQATPFITELPNRRLISIALAGQRPFYYDVTADILSKAKSVDPESVLGDNAAKPNYDFGWGKA